MMLSGRNICILAALIACSLGTAVAEDELITLFDFTNGSVDAKDWVGNPRVHNVRIDADGLTFDVADLDPWITGPVAAPHAGAGAPFFMYIKMKSTADASGEVFFGLPNTVFDPADSRSFFIKPDGEWHEYQLLLPAAASDGKCFRIDPANDAKGTISIAWIKIQPLHPLTKITFDPPKVPVKDVYTLKGGGVVLEYQKALNQFSVNVDGIEMATSPQSWPIGVIVDGKVIMNPVEAQCSMLFSNDQLEVTSTFSVGGAEWTQIQKYTTAPEGINVEASILCNRDAEIFHMPWLMLFPGLGTYGEEKTQAVLAGVEYLENEPSSSEADFNASLADRRIVDDYKLTFPLMSLVYENRYVGVIWDRADKLAAVFDSPDRLTHSKAHLMGLWSPGVGNLRLENDINPMKGIEMKAGEPLTIHYTLIGGRGDTVNESIQNYLALRPLPQLPNFEGGFDAAIELLSAGWLDSALQEDGTWRHAVWGDSFQAAPAKDAIVYMMWLASQTKNEALKTRLGKDIERGLRKLPKNNVFKAETVSHILRPTPLLTLGEDAQLIDYIREMTENAQKHLTAFDAQGILHYVQEDKEDYGKTHYADHTAGFSACALEPILEAAAISGDKALTDNALLVLDKITVLYENTVPRGAQTWEMPLHTPDILGSGRLVHCYLLGWMLSGNPQYLQQAQYWAWTGMSMVYLDPPIPGGRVGNYCTIGVIGATNWVAPNWLGQPVQWCGLVYRSAIEDLARNDPANAEVWKQVASGITITGLQESFPLTDKKRQGLLPDFFLLKPQLSEGPAISPGTVQATLPEAYGKGRMYDYKRIGGLIIHVPGEITSASETADKITLKINAWPEKPYRILISGSDTAFSKASWNGNSVQGVRGSVGAFGFITVEGSGELILRR